MSTPATLAEIRNELQEQFYERHEAIDAMLLAVLTRQHCFLLGPPGTAKSLLVRALVARFTGATYFETLLSKNRPDSAVLGPYDLPLLRDKGEFKRKDAGYLTSVRFTFLDEVGKASPTLGHDLLAALNERIKHEVGNDRSAHAIPLHTAFTASNELLATESEDEAALWDRLLFRCTVDYIAHDGLFKQLMERADSTPTVTTMPYEELVAAADAVQRVVLLDDVLDAVVKIRTALRKDGITVGDRRWRESMKGVRATAYLAGRDVAQPEDLLALRYTLWEDLEQKPKIERVIMEHAAPAEAEIAEMLDGVNELLAEMAAKAGESTEKLAKYIPEAMGKANRIQKAAKTMSGKLEGEGRPTTSLDKVFAGVTEVQNRARELMGFDF